MSLRSILGGGGRVRKSSKGSGAKRPDLKSSTSSTSSSSTWTSALPRRKAGTNQNGKKRRSSTHGDEEEDDLFDDKLDDYGLVTILATDLNLRDTPQAIRYIRDHMFSPLPEQAAGMNSTRIAEVLNYRRRLPPVVTVAHIQTLLASPSAVEREIAELVRSGFLRKIVVPRRGDIGEAVMLAEDYEKMVRDSVDLNEGSARDSLILWVKQNPGRQDVDRRALQAEEIDQLIKAGFLTSHHHTGVISHGSMSGTMSLYARPEDRSTLTSLETVARQPTGTLGTVGGEGAVHNAGGSGGGSGRLLDARSGSDSVTELKLAVPGNGAFLKLLSSALAHLVSLLDRSRFREAPESTLRDRWDGGIAKPGSAKGGGGGGYEDEDGVSVGSYAAMKRSRGEFFGVLPGQTKKWRQLYGMSFDWVLREAVGSGLVEVFATGSVGRGVRAT